MKKKGNEKWKKKRWKENGCLGIYLVHFEVFFVYFGVPVGVIFNNCSRNFVLSEVLFFFLTVVWSLQTNK